MPYGDIGSGLVLGLPGAAFFLTIGWMSAASSRASASIARAEADVRIAEEEAKARIAEAQVHGSAVVQDDGGGRG